MSGVSKLFATEQLKISQLTFGQLSGILADGETTIYVDTNGILKIATKNSGTVEVKNAAGDTIKSLNVAEIPPTSAFPPPDVGYALIAVQDGEYFKLVWGSVDTNGNYNVISGSTSFLTFVTNPAVQIYDPLTPGNYPFNGILSINTSGDGATAGKKYSIDNGITFTPIDNGSSYQIENLGTLTGATYQLVIQDSGNATLYSETITFSGVSYFWDFIDADLHVSPLITHIVYKSDDINPNDPATMLHVKVTAIDDGSELYPGLYTYSILCDGFEVFNVIDTEDTEIMVPILGLEGTYTAMITRKNPGYVRLGYLNDYGYPLYAPSTFTWSTDDGNSFSSPGNSTPPFSINPTTQEITISYPANALEIYDYKTIYAKFGSNIYQYTHNLIQAPSASIPVNVGVVVTGTTGQINDLLFSSPNFFSDFYDVPNVILKNNPIWVVGSSPPNKTDLYFRVDFLSTAYYGSGVTELKFRIEDITGTLLVDGIGQLTGDDPDNGQTFYCTVPDFEDIMTSVGWGSIVRIRFTFTPDNSVPPAPQDDRLSKLKFVRFLA
jgi:hypothetical protein